MSIGESLDGNAAPEHRKEDTVKNPTELIAELSLLEKAALVSGANTWQTRAVERLGIPAIWMSDGPHGLRKQLGSADHLGMHGSEPATCFPTAATVANSWDEDLGREIGAAIAWEAREQGVHVLLGPGLNIKRSPLGGRGFEYYSEDPELSGRLAAAYVSGIQSQGVAATPKHYAVNSQELRRMVSDSVIDERTLREIYLTAFEIVVKSARPWAIMSAYNLINGTFAHEHSDLLQKILRDEWGFDGAVISDWGGSNDAVEAVRAGGTIEMPSPGFDSVRQIVRAVENGDLNEHDLDARVLEVLTLVERVDSAAPAGTSTWIGEHHQLARRAAAESTVLLRNEGVLPLAAGTRVALIGDFAATPRYQGAGSSLVNPTRLTTLLQSISETSLSLTQWVRGYQRNGTPDDELLREAKAVAATADVVVLAVGLPESAESEGLDRADLTIPRVQRELIQAITSVNPRTVVVISGGGVVEMPWLDSAAAVLHTYLGGQSGAEAIWDVLTGQVDPGGRLAETFPLQLSDTPTAGRFPSPGPTAEYREGVQVGYRWYHGQALDVAFPFGFGLSYTSFTYSDVDVTDTHASITVTNTGSRPGTDVVQMYVQRLGPSAVVRPAAELKGFAKVRLAPSQSQRVRIEFTDRTFRFFDTRTAQWEIETGDYEIYLGRHFGDTQFSRTLPVTGTTSAPPQALCPPASAYPLGDDEFSSLLGRPVPATSWHTGALTANDPMNRLQHARSALGRGAYRVLVRQLRKAEKKGEPDLNALFLFNGPFRVISKMSNGLATQPVTDAVVTLANGRSLPGAWRVVCAFLRGRAEERRTRQAFTRATKGRRS